MSRKGQQVGYSGAPLSTKLGLGGGGHLLAMDPPDHYSQLLEPLPSGSVFPWLCGC